MLPVVVLVPAVVADTIKSDKIFLRGNCTGVITFGLNIILVFPLSNSYTTRRCKLFHSTHFPKWFWCFLL